MSKVLLTPIDSLVELLKQKKVLSFSQIQQQIKVPFEILEKWMIVLEEYKIVKTHYQGFEGYAEYTEVQKASEVKEINIDNIKEFFIESCKRKKLDDGEMGKIWPDFILHYEFDIKQLFSNKAKSLGFDEKKMDIAWQKYKKDLETL